MGSVIDGVYLCVPCPVIVWHMFIAKVIREKSRGEGSLIEQDTIENVSEPKFFF